MRGQQMEHGRAVVLGAGIGGLFAARVLSDHYPTVDVFDRDELPDTATHRRGVPHDVHLHGLLARGRTVLEAYVRERYATARA